MSISTRTHVMWVFLPVQISCEYFYLYTCHVSMAVLAKSWSHDVVASASHSLLHQGATCPPAQSFTSLHFAKYWTVQCSDWLHFAELQPTAFHWLGPLDGPVRRFYKTPKLPPRLLHPPILLLLPCHFQNCFSFLSSPSTSGAGKFWTS